MGRKEFVCGAVSGGILVLGFKFGRGDREGESAKEATYEKTRELINRFTAKHGTVMCRELLNGCELLTEEGQRFFEDNQLKDKACKPCIGSAIQILEELLNPLTFLPTRTE
jgi:C_GCAxxG_C_C family probable redox protein